MKRNCIYEIEREESISKTVGILKRNCRYEIEREESHGLQAGTTSTKLNAAHEEQKGYVDGTHCDGRHRAAMVVVDGRE